MNDMRNMRGMDGRRVPPRNSRGEFRRRRRGDRGMDYAMQPEMRDGRVIRSYPTIHPQGDYARGDMNYDMARGGRGRGRGDYGEYDMARQDMATMDYRGGDYRGGQMMGDGHYMHGRQSGYEPVEFMGYCQGYYGSPDQDYGRGRDYGYDMRGRRDYGYDYGYDYGDYGEDALSKEELKEWEHKLMGELDEREKQMFKREVIIPKFKQMGIEMKDFTEDELYVFTLAKYLDHKHSIGQNPDLSIKIAKDNLCDEDIAYQGSMYLMKYFDTFVEPRN